MTFPPPSRGLTVDRIGRREALDRTGEAILVRFSDASGEAVEIVCSGFSLGGTELRIVADDGHESAPRHIGPIELRGTSVTRGYWRNEAQTKTMLDDGWLDTGDLGYVADGELFVTGRSKDMIIRGCRHYFPYELEDTIGRLPDVVHGGVAVCGAVDPRGATERVIVIAETTLASVQREAREQLRMRINAATIALYGAPAEQIALVPPHSIVKTPSGKIRHAATLEQLELGGEKLEPRPLWRQLGDMLQRSLSALGRRAFERTWRSVLERVRGAWRLGLRPYRVSTRSSA